MTVTGSGHRGYPPRYRQCYNQPCCGGAQRRDQKCGLPAILAREQIRDRLTQLAPIFLKNKYMLGDDFSMLDVAIAPLLWRLDYYGIDLSKNAVPLLKYAERIFSRPAYIEALTPSEKVMRK